MTPVAASAPSLPSFIKMEDRKRAAGQSTDDLAPPTKRQAINGAGKAAADSDNTAPWSEDIEVSSQSHGLSPLARVFSINILLDFLTYQRHTRI